MTKKICHNTNQPTVSSIFINGLLTCTRFIRLSCLCRWYHLLCIPSAYWYSNSQNPLRYKYHQPMVSTPWIQIKTDKSQFLIIKADNTQITLTINSIDHLNQLISKVAKHCHLLLTTHNLLNQTTAICFYNYFIYSHLLYDRILLP